MILAIGSNIYGQERQGPPEKKNRGSETADSAHVGSTLESANGDSDEKENDENYVDDPGSGVCSSFPDHHPCTGRNRAGSIQDRQYGADRGSIREDGVRGTFLIAV